MMIKKVLIAAALVASAALALVGVVAPASATTGTPYVTAAPVNAFGGDSNIYYGSATVSPDGKYAIVVFEYGGGAILYDVAAGTTTEISINSGDMGAAVFAPDNSVIYMADYDNDKVLVYNLETSSFDAPITGVTGAYTLQISPDGAYLYVADESGNLFQVTLSSGAISASITPGTAYTYNYSMCISADGSTLYYPDYNSSLIAVALNNADFTASAVTTFSDFGAATSPQTCQSDSDGTMIVAGGYNVWKVAANGDYVWWAEGFGAVKGATSSCDAVYVADSDNYFQGTIPALALSDLSDLASLTVPQTDSGDGFNGYSASRSLDGSVVAIGGYYSSDALAIVISPECVDSPVPPTPSLPDTGADSNTVGPLTAVGAGLLMAGVLAIIVIRRRTRS